MQCTCKEQTLTSIIFLNLSLRNRHQLQQQKNKRFSIENKFVIFLSISFILYAEPDPHKHSDTYDPGEVRVMAEQFSLSKMIAALNHI